MPSALDTTSRDQQPLAWTKSFPQPTARTCCLGARWLRDGRRPHCGRTPVPDDDLSPSQRRFLSKADARIARRATATRHPARVDGRTRAEECLVVPGVLTRVALRAAGVGDPVGFVGPHGDLDAVADAELVHQAGDVGLDGAQRDVRLLGDLAGGASRATAARICSSRSVSGSSGCLSGAPGAAWAKAVSSRVVMFGAMRASPLAAAWMAWVSRADPRSSAGTHGRRP